MNPIRVFIVEDDPMVADIHCQYVAAMKDFTVVGMAHDGRTALEQLEKRKRDVDLIILDIYMPELDGIHTLREIRRKGCKTDVIVVSAASDMPTINEVLRAGAFDYITKPFQAERLHSSLQSFVGMKEAMAAGPRKCRQEDIDRLFLMRNRKNVCAGLPKGLSGMTLERIQEILQVSEHSLSADEVAGLVSVSRVTARRYLEHLVQVGAATVERSYQEVGRPIHKYSLLG